MDGNRETSKLGTPLDSIGDASKVRFSLWARRTVLDDVKKNYKEDNCSCPSEFIEKAIRFYIGYLASGKNDAYLSATVVPMLKSIVAESDNRICRILFKMAVELAVTMNVVAVGQEIDPVSLQRMQGECVKEVQRINGTITFQDAYKWQKG